MPSCKSKSDNRSKNSKTSHKDNTAINIEKIRQAGICKHYEWLKDQGLSPKECLEKTAEFARISEKQASGILTDNIQPTGRKTSSVSEYLAEIENSPDYEQTRCAIEKDPKLNDEEKRALTSELVRNRQEAKKLSHTQNIPISKPKFKSITDAIKDFDNK